VGYSRRKKIAIIATISGVKFNHKLTVTAGSSSSPINIVPCVKAMNNNPYEMSLNQSFLVRVIITALFFLLNAKGSKHKKARLYLSPAYVNGGISANPHFIKMNEVDHRKVTSSARKIAFR